MAKRLSKLTHNSNGSSTFEQENVDDQEYTNKSTSMDDISKKDKSTIEDYCIRLDTKYTNLMRVCYGLIAAIIAAGALQFVTFGEVKAQEKATSARVETIWKEFVPMMLMEGLQKNQNYQTEEIIATLSNDKAKIKEINAKYLDFQKTMLNNIIIMRGGVNSTTRSGKNSPTGSK